MSTGHRADLDRREASPAAFAIVWLLVLALAIAINNYPAPASQNEEIYMVGAYRFFHPEFLRNDWVFFSNWPENTIFNAGVGIFTKWFSVPAIVWAGRAISYAVMLFAFLRIGRRFGLPAWLAGVGIALWLAQGQSFVGGERIIAGFEGKAIGCAFFLLGVDQLMLARYLTGGALLGAAFSVHPAVGAVGGFAAVVALFTVPRPWRALVRTGLAAAVFAAPGFIVSLPVMLSEGGSARADLRYLTLERMPFHFDALRFPKRDLVGLALCFAFSAAHAWTRRRDAVYRWVLGFEIGLAIIFIVGYGARVFEVYEILKITPFRLFPVLVPLFFFFHLFAALREPGSPGARPLLAALGLAALLTQTNPIGGVGDQGHQRRQHWERFRDEVAQSFDWVAVHTPDTAIVLLPPWRKDSYYRAQRAQVISAEAYRYDRIREYRTRLEAVVGSARSEIPGPEAMSFNRMEQNYNALAADSVLALARRYGASWFVSGSAYPFPERFRSGNYRVYQLPPP